MSAARADDGRPPPSALHELAAVVGIIDAYVDQAHETRATSDDTRRALLAAMGIDASTDDAARDALAGLRDAANRELIAPARVVTLRDPSRRLLTVRAPASRERTGPWFLEIESEQGERSRREGPWRGDTELDLSLPDLPLGVHRIRLTLDAGGREWINEQTLIVAPERCVMPHEILGDRDVFGVTTNLYTLRSDFNWGIGDLSDLGRVAAWAGEVGAEFVGVSPLHALLDRGGDISPYSPVSRLFRNPIYIDVMRVPELVHDPALGERLTTPEIATELADLRESPLVRYDAVMAVKGLALDALHRVFVERVRGSGDARDRAYDDFVARRGPALTQFALWMSIAELPDRGPDWRAWPAEFRSPDTPAARRFADTHAARLDFHRWLQFEIDRQLGDAASVASSAGMQIGLYHDLAIGTSSGGADTWAYPDLFVHGACVGAPPDPYSAAGQNWGFPPIDPRALRQTGYRYLIDVLRAAFEHAGALRIDHVLGLSRLFWISNEQPTTPGAYVRYPMFDLLGILALESARHQALVVGEDLGTVSPDVPGVLEQWGILSSKVLEFERDAHGGFKPARDYPALSFAMANTHDMAPFAGFWNGRDIDIRRQLGLIVTDADADHARVARDAEKDDLLRLFGEEHVLPAEGVPGTAEELSAAVHAFLFRTPARLVAVSLDDLAGETTPVNVPGVTTDRYPTWSRKMRRTLESITTSDDVVQSLPAADRRHAPVG